MGPSLKLGSAERWKKLAQPNFDYFTHPFKLRKIREINYHTKSLIKKIRT